MASELLNFIIQNIDRLKPSDFIILAISLFGLATSAGLVIHWLYRNAFQMQGEVIRSQEKLIELKNQAITDYEKHISDLKAENEFHSVSLETHTEKLKHLEEANKVEKENSQNLLLYAASNHMGVLIAQALILRLELTSRFRFLIRVYASIRNQHHEIKGIEAGILYKKIDNVEDFIWEQSKLLNSLNELSIEQAGASGLPRELVSYTRGKLDDQFKILETEIVTAILPTLKKYEPEFAERVLVTYNKKRHK